MFFFKDISNLLIVVNPLIYHLKDNIVAMHTSELYWNFIQIRKSI